MTRTLVVTNDFPPRQGGIQTFVAALLERLPPDDLVVLASTSPGAAEHDAGLPYRVVRLPTPMMLPTPRTARVAADLVREHRAQTVVFGAAAPLGCSPPACAAPARAAPSGSPTGTRPAGWRCRWGASCCSGSPARSTS